MTVPRTPDSAISATVGGYRGIWFNIGQYSSYGPKYSGGFATYTAKHRPMAIYAPAVDKTFFTYGGTTAASETHLLIMASCYDHGRHEVPRPTVVLDRNGVSDPHDNPSIQLDQEGYVYIFVSGRNLSRPGHIFKSREPYSVEGFEQLSPAEGMDFTYPQIWYLPGNEAGEREAFFHMFTRYTDGRELYFSCSEDAQVWSPAQKIVGIGGHYETSAQFGNRVGTAFERHPAGDVDARTDLYYIQTDDRGKTWTTVDGKPLQMPLTEADNPARIIDYSSLGRLVYVKDMVFDEAGRPVILYLTSSSYKPGPEGEPRMLQVARWDGSQWVATSFPPSVNSRSTHIHNYCTGCLSIRNGEWVVFAPTGELQSLPENVSQECLENYWGQGGEIEKWVSLDCGESWCKHNAVTLSSPRKNGYVRSVVNARDPFYCFWTDGNPASISEAHIYFGNSEGTGYWELPYSMDGKWTTPICHRSKTTQRVAERVK